MISEHDNSQAISADATQGDMRSMTAEEVKNSPLTTEEIQRLTFYKWRYTFETFGFDQTQVKDLVFLTWLNLSGRVGL